MKYIKTIIRRVIISAIREGRIKRVDLTGIKTDNGNEEFLDRESFQHYGFTSTPVDDQAEGVMIGIGNVFYLIGEDDRRYRIVIAKGEVALYTDEGDKIHLKRGNIIEIVGQSKVIINSPDVELGNGTLLRLIDERIVAKHNSHVHATAATGPPSTPTVQMVLNDVSTVKTKGS
jgi:phage gp45-like